MLIDYSILTDVLLEKFKNDVLFSADCQAAICMNESFKCRSTGPEFRSWADAAIAVFDSVMADDKLIDTRNLGNALEYRIENLFHRYKKLQLINNYAQENPDKIVY